MDFPSSRRKEHYYRHVKRCGTQEHQVKCLYCGKIFGRKDDMKRHMKKKHLEQSGETFVCNTCQKTFHYEKNLSIHQRTCGKAASKKFKCPHLDCSKLFTRKAMMERHRDRDHQTGGGLKRKVEDTEEMKKKYRKGDDDDPSLTVSLEDDVLANACNAVQRQLAYQEQIGGSAKSREPGRFEFKPVCGPRQ